LGNECESPNRSRKKQRGDSAELTLCVWHGRADGTRGVEGGEERTKRGGGSKSCILS
jgi:hypothetical protein